MSTINYGQISSAVQEALDPLVHDMATLAHDDDDDDPFGTAAMDNPLLTEWVLIANVADLATGAQAVLVLNAPQMLRSHVLGLIALSKDTR